MDALSLITKAAKEMSLGLFYLVTAIVLAVTFPVFMLVTLLLGKKGDD